MVVPAAMNLSIVLSVVTAAPVKAEVARGPAWLWADTSRSVHCRRRSFIVLARLGSLQSRGQQLSAWVVSRRLHGV
eukprot:245830-Pyramimonas_sp.AAC.1